MPHSKTLALLPIPLNPEHEYVYLSQDGQGLVVPGGGQFWSLPAAEMAKFEQGWVVSEFVCSENWQNWELHPNADEFVYLLSGDIEFVQELPSGVATMRINGSGAVLVPRGVWHTARVFAPSRMLFVTMGGGTQHKPFSGGV